MLPFRYQLLGHLLVGCLAGWLLGLALRAPAAVPPVEPFTTRPDMLAVTVVLHRQGAPEIAGVEPLAEGRLTVTRPGAYSLVLEDTSGETLYRLSFQVVFVIPGLERRVEENRLLFVVPAGPEVARLVVSGPHGSAAHELMQDQ